MGERIHSLTNIKRILIASLNIALKLKFFFTSLYYWALVSAGSGAGSRGRHQSHPLGVPGSGQHGGPRGQDSAALRGGRQGKRCRLRPPPGARRRRNCVRQGENTDKRSSGLYFTGRSCTKAASAARALGLQD